MAVSRSRTVERSRLAWLSNRLPALDWAWLTNDVPACPGPRPWRGSNRRDRSEHLPGIGRARHGFPCAAFTKEVYVMAAVMTGAGPHKSSHTAVAITASEQTLGELQVRACAAQAERLLDVHPELGARVRLLATGDLNKNDPSDARSVAIAALRSPSCRDVMADDHAAVLKVCPGGTATLAAPAPRWPAGCTRCCASWSPAACPSGSPQARSRGSWLRSRQRGPWAPPAATSPLSSSRTCAASMTGCVMPDASWRLRSRPRARP
jgi:hypothetical protein